MGARVVRERCKFKARINWIKNTDGRGETLDLDFVWAGGRSARERYKGNARRDWKIMPQGTMALGDHRKGAG